ncbi:MAG: ABC transporter ATP-binding protein [Lautropia sp.]|nr:ABC transporter ATP-binding protein [Lautropia sp.]
MRLSLHEVSMRVGANDHLYPMSLAVEPAGITVLLGPTLAGKTSLMRLMAGLDVPTQGRVQVDGVDVTGVPVRKRRVAMVYQQFINYPSMTVFDNIASPLKLAGSPGIEQTVTSLARRLHIDHLLDRLPAQLSGGQQQRVALARALAKDAPLILLDEPLVNLDYKLREELREELAQLFQSGTSSVVYATTEPAEALLLGGHTAVLDRGRLLQYGRTIDVFMKPATIEVARAFSDPPINLVPAQLERNLLLIDQGPKIALHGPLATDRPQVTVGIRAGDLRVEGRAGDVHFEARVELAEISGSDSFVHVTSRLGPLVVQLVGVHRFELGQVLRLHVDPGAIYIFDHAGALLLAPELVQSRERLRASLPEIVQGGGSGAD